MTTNVGTTDRILRLIAGIVLILLPRVMNAAIFDSTALVIAATVIGLVLIGTALFRFCPLYSVLGMNTCGVK